MPRYREEQPIQRHRDRWQRARLLARIQRRYRTAVQLVECGGVRLEFTSLADVDQELDRLTREAEAASSREFPWQPYWAQAWDSSRGLCEMLASHCLWQRRVLDLGCGLGLAGSVAAARGAVVTMVDFAQPALLFARLNSWPWSSRVAVRRLDWRNDSLEEQSFDWILGADILYDRGDWEYLDRFWRRHLNAQGVVLLAEPGRTGAREFPAWMRMRGWRVTTSQVVVPDRHTLVFASRHPNSNRESIRTAPAEVRRHTISPVFLEESELV